MEQIFLFSFFGFEPFIIRVPDTGELIKKREMLKSGSGAASAKGDNLQAEKMCSRMWEACQDTPENLNPPVSLN